MKKFLVVFFLLISGLLRALSPPIVVEPKEPSPRQAEAAAKEYYEQHQDSMTAVDWYEIALVLVTGGQWDLAKRSLGRALALDPDLVDAYIQLGYIDVWQKNGESAIAEFDAALERSPCNRTALQGLTEVAVGFSKERPRRKDAIALLRQVQECDPENPDVLFYLGRALAWDGQRAAAEEALKKCLSLAPEYSDAAIQLAHLYVQEGKNEEAEAIFLQYPDNPEARKGRARIASKKGNQEEAKGHYQAVLESNPADDEARVGLSRSFASLMHYDDAFEQYELVQEESSIHWDEKLNLRALVHPGILAEMSYTQSHESDPSVNAPVVKTYYFDQGIYLLLPIYNRWRIDLKEIYFHQRENDIYPPIGVNYTAYLSGAQMVSHYFFAKDWKWDVILRGLDAWGSRSTNYPFRSTGRFEPGTLLMYNGEHFLFVADAHVESFIIKNFSITRSELLRVDYLQGAGGVRIPVWLQPSGEVWYGRAFYHDSLDNWKSFLQVDGRIGFPGLQDYLTLRYRYEHGHFKALTPNYFSYRLQLRNTAGGIVHAPVGKSCYLEGSFDHQWQMTRNLIQPIGSFIFTAAKQYLIGNKIEAKIGYRYRDRLKAEFGWHWFRNTLPYHDWRLNGSVLWQF